MTLHKTIYQAQILTGIRMTSSLFHPRELYAIITYNIGKKTSNEMTMKSHPTKKGKHITEVFPCCNKNKKKIKKKEQIFILRSYQVFPTGEISF